MRRHLFLRLLARAAFTITPPASSRKKEKGSGKKNPILAIGCNLPEYKNWPGIHAEQAALLRLPPRERGRVKDVSLLVVRFSKNGKLQSSKPCALCVRDMCQLPEKKGYRIKRVYYSDEKGNLVATTLAKLRCLQQ